MESFDAAERKRLEAAIGAGEPVVCPHCGTDLSQREVQRPPNVSYVRHRVWLLCPSCGRSGAVEVRAGGRS